MKSRNWIGAIVGTVMGSALLLAGCEDAEHEGNMKVTPTTAEVDKDTKQAVYFEVNASTNWYLPLEWSVSSESLGRISGSEGYSAVYESSGNGREGNNTITVRDQRHSEGIAVVTSLDSTPSTGEESGASTNSAAE